jgi:hypothetical protein
MYIFQKRISETILNLNTRDWPLACEGENSKENVPFPDTVYWVSTAGVSAGGGRCRWAKGWTAGIAAQRGFQGGLFTFSNVSNTGILRIISS